MNYSWYKIYSYLCGKYFICIKRIVKLLYVNENTVVYLTLRNGKLNTTSLSNFVKFFSIVNYKGTSMSAKSGIVGYVHTKTSITIKFSNNDAYRYDLSKALNQAQLKEMVTLAEKGSGLNSYLNKHPQIRKAGYIDTTLNRSSSYTPY